MPQRLYFLLISSTLSVSLVLLFGFLWWPLSSRILKKKSKLSIKKLLTEKRTFVKSFVIIISVVSVVSTYNFIGIYDIQDEPAVIEDIEITIKPKDVVRITNDYEGAKVSPRDLEQGCFGQDCITSIDNPKFESVQEASTWLKDDDRVFVVNINGIQKAYPQRILNWHEIVNDDFGDIPVSVTFCPLCGTAVSFVRKVNSITTQFGVSGKLYNNDLVMYDRLEGNLWQQATAEAIVGPAARRNEYLEKIPTTTTTWKQWVEIYPDTLVLSIDTGFDMDYEKQPYGTYEENDILLFGVTNSDERLPLKEIVYGIVINEKPAAFTQELLSLNKEELYLIGDEVYVSTKYEKSGEVTFTNSKTGEDYQYLRGFWFAWAAFYPDTLLYK